MNKKTFVAGVLCIVALLVSAFAFAKPLNQTPRTEPSPKRIGSVPDHIIYRVLLHQAVLFNEKAEEAERLGKNGSAHAYRNAFKQDAELSDEQVGKFNQVAASCEQEVRDQDAKARVIIDARRAEHQRTGQVVPPSPELEVMQQERNAIILRCRDRLHEAFGEQEWGRFQGFLQQRVVPTITVTQAQPPAPNSGANEQPHQQLQPERGIK